MTENTTTTIETPVATVIAAPTHANGKPISPKKAAIKAAKAKKAAKAATATKPAKEQVTATKEVKPAATTKPAAAKAAATPDNRPLKADGKPIAKGWAAILRYLAKHDATTKNAAISKADAMKGGCPNGGWYELADLGWGKAAGLNLLARTDAEGEEKTTYLTERFYLTAAGKAAAKKLAGK